MIPTGACPDCPRKYRPISGDGPLPSPVLIVGERPGKTEHQMQQVFVGKTGEELNRTYLPLAHLDRDDIRVCNAVRCWADNNRTPTPKEVLACAAHHLPAEIESTQPDLLILMGGSACKLVPSIRLDTHHGPSQWGRLFDYEGWILPMYHPALGLHESKWMTQLLDDWATFDETWILDEPSYPTDYRMAETWADLSSYLDNPAGDRFLIGDVGADTEDHGGVPWSIQVSTHPGSARLIRSDNKDCLNYLKLWARLNPTAWDLHFAVHDLDVLAQMGVHPPHYRDTMQEAFHLGNLPQALKPLVYRLFHFRMTSWEDVVWPYSIEALITWIVEAAEISKRDLSYIDVKKLKTKVKETVRKGPLESLCNRLLQHTDKASEYDPWERLDDFWLDEANEWMTTHIEARIGRYPIKGIANAPLAKAVTYACGDADWTGQVAVELQRRRRDRFWQIAPEDRDH